MKIFMMTFVFCFSLFATHIDEFASDVNYLRDYNTALTKAKKEDKMIMLLVVADYCPWCKKFERKVLKNKDIQKEINKNFIPVVIDKLKEVGKYPPEYKSPLIPAIYFIDPKTQKAIYSTVGYMKRKEFKPELEKAVKLFEDKK